MSFYVLDQSSAIFRNRVIQNHDLAFLTKISHDVTVAILVVISSVSRTRRQTGTLLLQVRRVVYLLSWEAVVVNVDPKILALAVCIYHKLNSRNFDLALRLV